MLNKEIARTFELLADLLEIEGGDRFRIGAYRRAARTLGDLTQDIAELAASGRLQELAGVGAGTARKIQQFIDTGTIEELAVLGARIPPALSTLLRIPGLGPKKVGVLWKELGVADVPGLKEAIVAGRLQKLRGFGAQSARKIEAGLAFLERSGKRVPLGQALELGESLLGVLRTMPGVIRSVIAGSARRGTESVGDLDLLCVAAEARPLVQGCSRLPGAASVIASGEAKGSILFDVERDLQLQVDLLAVPEQSFGAALQYFTGSKEHNVRLRERAVSQGLRLSEWGLFDGSRQVAGQTEEGIYAALGLVCPPPEQREDRGEFLRGAAFFEELVRLEDIRGDLHVHTTASDGRSPLEELAPAARAKGYAYLNITDHSPSAVIAGGLSIERMAEHMAAVRDFARSFQGLSVLVGCECDILVDGRLDYPDEILAQCDIVVASVHVAQTQDLATMTRRAIRAMENPHVDVLGHPTGRLLGSRAASEIDIREVARAAAATGTALEINASWRRLDLKDRHVEEALEAGALLSINTDTHHVSQLDQMKLGILTARRGGAPASRVINTFSLEQLRAWKTSRRE